MKNDKMPMAAYLFIVVLFIGVTTVNLKMHRWLKNNPKCNRTAAFNNHIYEVWKGIDLPQYK